MLSNVFGFCRRAALPLLLVGIAAHSANAQEATKLRPGMAAPELKAAKWVKGSKIDKLEKGKVYVVEFWATWCGPCKVSIPHLTELAKKFKGKVTFIGMDIWETDPDEKATLDKNGVPEFYAEVDKFVKEMGDKMDYNVAIDTTDGHMTKKWMEAAGEDGIPSAFVIDQDGKIAWIGHPMGGLDDVVSKVVAKKWDTAAEAKKQEEAAKKEEALIAAVRKAAGFANDKDFKQAVAVLEEVYPKADADVKDALTAMTFGYMSQYDEAGAYALAKDRLKKKELSSVLSMNQMAWEILTESRFKNPDIDLAWDLADRAVKATKSQDGMVMDTLALATFKKGQVDKAIELQTKAIELVKALKQPELANTLEEMEARLATFKKAKGG